MRLEFHRCLFSSPSTQVIYFPWGRTRLNILVLLILASAGESPTCNPLRGCTHPVTRDRSITRSLQGWIFNQNPVCFWVDLTAEVFFSFSKYYTKERVMTRLAVGRGHFWGALLSAAHRASDWRWWSLVLFCFETCTIFYKNYCKYASCKLDQFKGRCSYVFML